jgi:hypothetical protein
MPIKSSECVSPPPKMKKPLESSKGFFCPDVRNLFCFNYPCFCYNGLRALFLLLSKANLEPPQKSPILLPHALLKLNSLKVFLRTACGMIATKSKRGKNIFLKKKNTSAIHPSPKGLGFLAS